MEVLAFVGPTGTGKSHRASMVAHDYGADAIIDDGLLIKDNKIIAGSSAKYESNRIRAVKRAIFADADHAHQVQSAIESIQPHRLLILGTSRNMAEKIVQALTLPAITSFIDIHDVSTPAAIMKARETRRTQNKHIVPVPKIELQPHLPNFLIDPMRLLSRSSRSLKHQAGEASVVRPSRFSVMGKLIISEHAMVLIVRHEILSDKGFAGVSRISVGNVQNPEKGLTVKLDVSIRYGVNIPIAVKSAQERIKSQIEYMTWMTVTDVNIVVRALVAP